MKRIAVIIGVLFLVGCGQVNQGERALFSRWGIMEQKTYGPGLYFYEPFGTNMDTYNVQEQKQVEKGLTAATSDTQPVIVDVAVNYRIKDSSLHLLIGSDIGSEYVSKVLHPAILDSVKAGTAQFHLVNLIKEREKLRALVKADLAARMESKHLIVLDVQLTNIDVSKEFIHAVEQKQIAEHNVITATRNAESARALSIAGTKTVEPCWSSRTTGEVSSACSSTFGLIQLAISRARTR